MVGSRLPRMYICTTCTHDQGVRRALRLRSADPCQPRASRRLLRLTVARESGARLSRMSAASTRHSACAGQAPAN